MADIPKLDLSDFISAGIQQVLDGIKKAKEAVPGGVVLPTGLAEISALNSAKLVHAGNVFVAVVEFDVAVTHEKADKVQGKTAGDLWLLKAAVEGEKSERHGNANRIRFSVPIRLS